MYVLKLIQFIKRSHSAAVLSKLSPLNNSQQNFVRKKLTESFDVKSQVENDVLLFKLEKPKFFIFMNLFSGLQCLFWSYLGLFLVQPPKDYSSDLKVKQFWNEVFPDTTYRYILGSVALIFGWSIFGGTCFYTTRSIRKIILHRGGKSLTIVTYKLPGVNNTISLPIRMVSASQHRTKAKKFVPLKLKDRYFYFLVDKEGKFMNPKLFDFTAGINRNI